jgi:hypothetical protein
MNTFLKKLDDMAGRLLNNIDTDLQQPVTAVITGEVFTHDDMPSINDNTAKPGQPTPKPAVPAAVPARKTNSAVRTPMLKNAR